MALQTYNGWTGHQRTSRLAELNAGRKAGTLPSWAMKVGPCSICTQPRGTMWHAESYGPSFEAYIASFKALCGHCHAMLHLRFRFPGRWRLHLLMAAGGPVPFVAHVGVVFARARTWGRDLPATGYVPGDEWFHRLLTTR